MQIFLKIQKCWKSLDVHLICIEHFRIQTNPLTYQNLCKWRWHLHMQKGLWDLNLFLHAGFLLFKFVNLDLISALSQINACSTDEKSLCRGRVYGVAYIQKQNYLPAFVVRILWRMPLVVDVRKWCNEAGIHFSCLVVFLSADYHPISFTKMVECYQRLFWIC